MHNWTIPLRKNVLDQRGLDNDLLGYPDTKKPGGGGGSFAHKFATYPRPPTSIEGTLNGVSHHI